MDFKTLPKKGDQVDMYITHPLQTVIEVFPYTGRYPEFFTHVMKYTSPITLSGFNEITINVDQERKNQNENC